MENTDHKLLVYNIFSNFFGEDRVDLQEQNIIVYFPKVTVTNEHDRSIDITELWVKVGLAENGTISGTFQMLRSELTIDQLNSGYSHSHIPGIFRENFNKWSNPCLGGGPIRDTIASLSCSYSEELWNLFCFELSKYVATESISGVPYRYLEHVGKARNKVTYPTNSRMFSTIESNEEPIISMFIPYIIERKPFKFNFINGSYGIAMSYYQILITLSNLFIEWYNSLPKEEQPSIDELFTTGFIIKGEFRDNQLYVKKSVPIYDYSDLIGSELLHFKGRPITFNIVNSQQNDNSIILIDSAIAANIIERILRTINYKYERETNFSGKELIYV